ncbi:hypothetical protein LSS_18084 [Leptospira santarosai serovar Shermani str. LT 821]|uniref:Uncharacterized protein n=1 Tax=Leptospira santarosai serovar Shermani str. LT 821 TaxID=758847 RepID=K8Y3N8_9LEPT|nr:hypothetical protein LSS_18084 [Leptospira santarosai serovar Shermani str. LT 821]
MLKKPADFFMLNSGSLKNKNLRCIFGKIKVAEIVKIFLNKKREIAP